MPHRTLLPESVAGKIPTCCVQLVAASQLVTLHAAVVMAFALGLTILTTMIATTPPATRNSKNPMHLRTLSGGRKGSL